MPSTYTTSLGLEKQQTGENVNLWGLILNNTLDLIDQALDGIVNIPLTGSTASVTITNGQLSNGRCRLLYFSGALAAPCTVSLPPTTGKLTKLYWIVNNSGASVILQQLPANGIAGVKATVANGTSQAVYCDGLGNVGVLGSLSSTPGDFTVNGNETVTGNLTVNGSEEVKGNLTVDGDEEVKTNLIVDGTSHLKGLVTADAGVSVTGDVHASGNMFAGIFQGSLNFDGITCIQPYANTGSLGSGAGTGAVITKLGASDSAGEINITTGSSTAANSPIVTVNLTNPTTALNVVFSAMNAAAAAAGVWLSHDETPGDTISSFTLNSGNTPLTASTAFVWSFLAIK